MKAFVYKENLKSLGAALISGMFIVSIVLGCKNNELHPDAYGNFESRETLVAAEVSGKVVLLQLEEGQPIAKDVVVGKIDSVQVYLKLKQLKAQNKIISAKLAALNANVEVLKTRQLTALTELQRIEKLYAEKAATQQQYDQVKGSYNVLAQQVLSAEVQKQSISAERQALAVQQQMVEDQLQKCIIRNPVNGTVLEKYMEENELVGAGKPIYKIADLSTLELRVYVSGNQLTKVQIGKKVSIRVDEGEKLKVYEGVVSWISGEAEFTPKIIQTREERVKLVYAVKIKVPNDGGLKIGMPGEVVF